MTSVMEERSVRTGFPVSPADEIMRGSAPPPLPPDPTEGQPHPRPWRFLVWMVAVVMAAIFIAGCGGELKTEVDLTEDPPVEVRWEIQVRALCDMSAKERVDAMNSYNNEFLNESFLLVACPAHDPLNADAKPLLADGTPAMGVSVQVLYLFPEMAGEQASAAN